MLAFNLGVFFRNLQGEEVIFSARNDLCEVNFRGGVSNLYEHTDLTHHLSVTLNRQNLYCRIAFDEAEEEEALEETEVEVRVVQIEDDQEILLFQTAFQFEEIVLKPATGDEDPPGDGPLTA